MAPGFWSQSFVIYLTQVYCRRVLCINYLAGFCPSGKDCNDAHPKFELPAPTDNDPKLGKKVVITCHYCGEVGHKVSHNFNF